MNKYIVPICNLDKVEVHNEIIIARSINDCKDKLMDMYAEYSDSLDYNDFWADLYKHDILIGDITDIEEI